MGKEKEEEEEEEKKVEEEAKVCEGRWILRTMESCMAVAVVCAWWEWKGKCEEGRVRQTTADGSSSFLPSSICVFPSV